MEEEKYHRQVQTTVTNFLYCGDEYLFLKRNNNKRIDPGRLNGVGGRVEPGENYLEAAIRETEEETGYQVTPADMQLSAVAKLEGGYKEDFVMCFFRIKVPHKNIPIGNKTDDGELLWIHQDKVLNSQYELVDDLNYCFKDIIEGKSIIFFTAKVNDNEKIQDLQLSKLQNK